MPIVTARRFAPKSSSGSRSLGISFICLASVLYATEALFIRSLQMSSVSIAGIRTLLAFVVVGLVTRFTGRVGAATLGHTGRLIALGTAGALNSVAFVYAIQRADVALVLAIVYTWPLWVVLTHWILRLTRVAGSVVVALLGCVLGIWMLTRGSLTVNGVADSGGVLAAMVVALTMAVMVILEQSSDGGMSARVIYMAKAGVASVLLLPFAVASLDVQQLTIRATVDLLMLGAVISAGAGTLFIAGERMVTPAEAAATSYLQPIAGTIVAIWLLGETLTAQAVLGAGLVTSCSMYIVIRDQGMPLEQ